MQGLTAGSLEHESDGVGWHSVLLGSAGKMHTRFAGGSEIRAGIACRKPDGQNESPTQQGVLTTLVPNSSNQWRYQRRDPSNHRVP
jgi:hypothetical protein